MKFKGIILVLLLIISSQGCEKLNDQPENGLERIKGIRLAWDYSSLVKLAPLGHRINAFYPRMIQGQDKSVIYKL